ncbi:MAG: hypothetical protein M3068_13995 [Gemmatimonadota bacterium]|nr:hypothetical protein [Gemmatimonadota bacterium]
MRLAIGVAIASAVLAAPLAGQRDAHVDITLPAAAQRVSDPPYVRGTQLLSSGRLRELLLSGFPARMHYRLELWSAEGWLFNTLKSKTEWDVLVSYSALERRYTVARIAADHATLLGSFDDLRSVDEVIEQPFQPALRPPGRRGERFYYSATLDVELLSVNDLDELQRWLSGELQPAVQGRKSAGTAIGRGVGTLFTRLLGGERRHYEARSSKFRTE